MTKHKKGSRYSKIREELLGLFETGERLTAEKAITEYYSPDSPLSYVIAKKKIKSLFNSLKRHFLKENILFGSLDEAHHYGIPLEKEEFQHMGLIRYKQVKGIIRNTQVLVNDGVAKGLITARTEAYAMLLPRQEGENEGLPQPEPNR